MDRTTIQKTNKEIEDLDNTRSQLDQTDTYRTVHSATKKYTIFSSAHRTFCRTQHILGHKTNLNKFKRTEIIHSMFSNHNGMKLEIDSRRKFGKLTLDILVFL